MNKTCEKCGHGRTLRDEGPDYACPVCRVVYHKYKASRPESLNPFRQVDSKGLKKEKMKNAVIMFFISLGGVFFAALGYQEMQEGIDSIN